MGTTVRLAISILAIMASSLPVVHAADVVPSLPSIIEKVIARDEATQKALHSLQYRQVLNTQQLDKSGAVTKQQEVQMIVRPGAANEIQVISEKGDNLPGNPDEATLQAQGRKVQKQKLNFPLKDLVSRFDITLVGTGLNQHQSVYILAFEPKPDQKYENQTERVLNHLQGRIQVSTRDYSILQTDATLANPVNVAWIFAKVSALTFHYELDNTTGGFAPAQILTSVSVDAPLITIRQRMKVEISDIAPRASASSLVTTH